MKNIVTFLIISLFVFQGYAQDIIENDLVLKEIKISAGFTRVNIMENRLSTNSHRSFAPSYKMSFTKMRSNAISTLETSFFTNKVSTDKVLDLKFLRPNVTYSYTRKIQEGIFLGGVFNSNTLLGFPKINSGMYNNNPIAYTIANGIGPKIEFINRHLNDRWQVSGALESVLLSYLIRPAYAHPYPEKYLDEEVFSPTRRGMAGPLLRSGQVALPNKYASIKVKLGFFYQLSNQFKLGIEYSYEYFRSQLGKRVAYSGQDFHVFFSYQY